MLGPVQGDAPRLLHEIHQECCTPPMPGRRREEPFDDIGVDELVAPVTCGVKQIPSTCFPSARGLSAAHLVRHRLDRRLPVGHGCRRGTEPNPRRAATRASPAPSGRAGNLSSLSSVADLRLCERCRPGRRCQLPRRRGTPGERTRRRRCRQSSSSGSTNSIVARRNSPPTSNSPKTGYVPSPPNWLSSRTGLPSR